MLPRLAVVPTTRVDPVVSTLKSGIERSFDPKPPDPVVRVVLVVAGLLFVAVASISTITIDERGVRLYFGVLLGGIGLSLCAAGWRGL